MEQMDNHNHGVCDHTKGHCGHQAATPFSFPHLAFYPKPFQPRGIAILFPASLLYNDPDILAMHSFVYLGPQLLSWSTFPLSSLSSLFSSFHFPCFIS